MAAPSASSTASLGARSVAIDEEVDDDIPEVARRLWQELLCTCGEASCARPTLAACACEYAGKKRQEILDQVRRLGFASPARDEATYAAVLRGYTTRHGADAALTATHHREWLRWVLMVASALPESSHSWLWRSGIGGAVKESQLPPLPNPRRSAGSGRDRAGGN